MFTARLLGMEKLNPKRLAAAILAFGGVAVIFWRELVFGGSFLPLVAVFLAACAAPLAGLMLQRGPKQNAVATNAVGTLVGIPFAFAGSLILGEKLVLPSTTAQIFPVVYLAVVGSVGAFVIFAWLVNHWRATTISFLGVIVPVIAVVVGAVARQEKLAPGSLIGAAIVIVGVVFALRSESAGATPELSESGT
jgi:drug/metabolite transporter (DMT)-like permease